MDPFVSTIIKQGVALAVAVGAVALAVFFMIKMDALQLAKLNNISPQGMDA